MISIVYYAIALMMSTASNVDHTSIKKDTTTTTTSRPQLSEFTYTHEVD